MKTIATANAPRAIGPYSQAVIHDGLLYSAGQIALDPSTMELVGGDTAAQTEQVFANLRSVLEAAGASLPSVVKTTVYLADMGDFQAMNAVYARHFGDHRPARSTVAAAALPKGARVEIDVIAAVGA
jgi:2-iminobutanoate/2-iminopropanoate deaminase